VEAGTRLSPMMMMMLQKRERVTCVIRRSALPAPTSPRFFPQPADGTTTGFAAVFLLC